MKLKASFPFGSERQSKGKEDAKQKRSECKTKTKRGRTSGNTNVNTGRAKRAQNECPKQLQRNILQLFRPFWGHLGDHLSKRYGNLERFRVFVGDCVEQSSLLPHFLHPWGYLECFLVSAFVLSWVIQGHLGPSWAHVLPSKDCISQGPCVFQAPCKDIVLERVDCSIAIGLPK